MIRTIFRDNRMLFGPLKDAQLAVISHEPVFAGHGISVSATPDHVDMFITMPADMSQAKRVQAWFLRNHTILV